MITQQNYLKILQGTEVTLSQILRFMQNNKKPSKDLGLIRNKIISIISTQLRQDRIERNKKNG